MAEMDVSDPNYSANYDDKKPPDAAASAPAGADDDSDDEGMSDSVLLDSVTKDEWKSIEASLSHHKKNGGGNAQARVRAGAHQGRAPA